MKVPGRNSSINIFLIRIFTFTFYFSKIEFQEYWGEFRTSNNRDK